MRVLSCDDGVFVFNKKGETIAEFAPDTKVSFCKNCAEPFDNGTTGFKDNFDFCGGNQCRGKRI